jgi:hypothetical protein
MGLFSSNKTLNEQTTNLNDSSANAGGDNSLALGTNSDFTSASSGAGGLSLSNSSLAVVTDQGTVDVAKELSLAALSNSGDAQRGTLALANNLGLESIDLARKQTADLKDYVQSNQNFARSIAETALAAGTAQPLPTTSKNLFYIVGGVVVSFVLVVFALVKKSR